jgi:hypothetical protein
MHWLLDVEFKDDLSRYRGGRSAKNMAIVRPLRAWTRQQKQTKRQNSKKNSRLEPELSPRAASTQMSVNLDPLPWSPSRTSAAHVLLSRAVRSSEQ